MSEVQSSDSWDATLYDDRHAFVNQLAKGLVDLLAPRKGERILDLGCGTGALTNDIAAVGTDVLGIDASPSMIAQARRNYPALHFEVADALTMHFADDFDAVFSNAVLHWIRPPQDAAERMYAALKPGGRLVLEMGGEGNVAKILSAAIDAGRSIGIDLTLVININYFPSIGEYTSVLKQAGFAVGYATLFDRPTKLNDGYTGLANWIRMFRPGVEKTIPPQLHRAFFDALQNRCQDTLYSGGTWFADYRRLRVMAMRP